MKASCAIIIFNYNSSGFLRLCIRQIRKYEHPQISTHIIIADQSTDEDERRKVESYFGADGDVTIVPMPALRSGFAVDLIMREFNLEADYVCTLDVDCFPIHKNWLYVPIRLIQEADFKFVGGLFFESQKEETSHFYNKNNFFCLAQYFRVGRTEDYRQLAEQGGFTILHARPQTGFSYGNNDWLNWANSGDYHARGSDDCVIAHCWEDNFTNNNKLALAITHMVGNQNIESGYGRILDDLVFHLSFCHWSDGIEDRVGRNYNYWKLRMANADKKVIDDIVEAARLNPANPNHTSQTQARIVWNGRIKKSFPSSTELNKLIEDLKKK